jgi:hypothetical protein
MQRNADAGAFEQVMKFGFGVQVFTLNKLTAVPSFIGRWCALLGVSGAPQPHATHLQLPVHSLD